MMVDQARVDQLEEAVADLNSQIRKLATEKDKAVAKYRKDLLKLNADRDAVAAELVAARKVAGLSDAERAAVAAELAKVGD